MLLESDLSILTGEDVLVSFKSPADDRWFDCDAVIARVLHGRRCRDDGWRRRDKTRAVGIAFDAMDPWSEIVLCDHLRKHPATRSLTAKSEPRSPPRVGT
jgi:hypothetical protein